MAVLRSLNSCEGGDAVIVAVISLWRRDRLPDKAALEAFAVSAAPSVPVFESFLDGKVGIQLIEHSTLEQEFLDWLRDRPDVSGILGYASTKPGLSFRWAMKADLGAALKKSPWWKANSKEIEANRRRLKKVREIQES